MAVTKMIGAIHPPKSSKGGGRYKVLKNTINYILNPKKTENGKYTGSLNCNLDTALRDMIETKEYYGKTSDSPKERLGYHFSLAWSEEENPDYDTVLQITKEFCKEYLSDYEVVYSVHTDKKHPHAHIAFNSVNLYDGHKYRYEDGDWEKIIQPITDKLCQKHGLHTLAMDRLSENMEDDKKRKRKSTYYKRKSSERHNNTRYYKEENEKFIPNDFLRNIIDEAIYHSNNYQEFLNYLKGHECEVKDNKYLSIRGKGMERFRRSYQLGSDYTVEMIKQRIAAYAKPLPIDPRWKASKDMQDQFLAVMRVRKKELSLIQKKYYAKIYGLGLRKTGVNYNYQAIRQSIKEIDKMTAEVNYMIFNKIETKNDVEQIRKELEKKIDEVQTKSQELKNMQKPYKPFMKVYYNMKKLEKNAKEYAVNGNGEYEEVYNQYMEYRTELEKSPYTLKEIEEFSDFLKMKNLEVKEERKKLMNERDILNRIENRTKNDIPEEEHIQELDKTKKKNI